MTRSAAARALLLAVATVLVPACGGSSKSVAASGSPSPSPVPAPVPDPEPPPPDPPPDPPPPTSDIPQAPPQQTLDQPIQHVYVIVKGRHSYDSFFMAYPNASPSRVAPGANGSSNWITEPGNDHWATEEESWEGAHEQYDQGALDGFQQPEELMSGPFASLGVNPETGRRRIPYYWFLADQGVLSDRWFSHQFGPNFPNLVSCLAATSGGAVTNPDSGVFQILDPSTDTRTSVTRFDSSRIPAALPGALENAGLTWTIFQEPGATVPLSAVATTIDVVRTLPDYNQRVIVADRLDQVLPEYLARGWGGHVTFIHPADRNNELPVDSEVINAEAWTRAIVDAIGYSPDWDHAAVIILWDSYGGYYDRIAPPQVDAFGLGFRVPCLILSPYARRGVLDSTVREHSSIARFCERLFSLPTMNARDAAADDLFGAFDFTQTPRPYSDFIPPALPPADPGVETFPNEGRVHVPVGTVVAYQTDPPTSGNHYPDPQQGGYYTTEIASGFLVHSMEHGGVIIYYDPSLVSSEDLGSLQVLANKHLGLQAQVCVVPRTDAAYPVILTAWTHRLRLAAYDGARIQEFLREWLGRGPE